MTQYRVSSQLLHRRDAGESQGAAVAAGGAVAERTSVVGGEAGGTTSITNLPVGVSSLEQIVAAQLTVNGTAIPATDDTVIWTWRGLEGWMVLHTGTDGFVSTGELSITSAGVAGFSQDVLNIPEPVNSLVGNLDGGKIQIRLWVQPTDPMLGILGGVDIVRPAQKYTHKLLDLFADDSPQVADALPDVGPLMARTLKLLRSRGLGKLTLAAQVGSQGPIVVNQVAGAFTLNQPFITSADIGLGFGQINPNPNLRTAAQYAPHPSAFVRQSDRILNLQTYSDGLLQMFPLSIADDPLLTPLEVVRAPSHSVWRIVIDGTTQEVVVSHGALDLRRPRDIWQKVWVPAIQRGGALPLTTFSYIDLPGSEVNDEPTRTFYSSGVLETLDYLDYAACLAVLDSNTDLPIIQPVRQGGGGNGGGGGGDGPPAFFAGVRRMLEGMQHGQKPPAGTEEFLRRLEVIRRRRAEPELEELDGGRTADGRFAGADDVDEP